jgi:hypothetical protein
MIGWDERNNFKLAEYINLMEKMERKFKERILNTETEIKGPKEESI